DEVAEGRRARERRRLQHGPCIDRPGPEGADASPAHLVLEERERPAAELGGHLGVGVVAERRPGPLELLRLAAAVLAAGQVLGEGAARGLVGLAGQALDRECVQVAAVHDVSPSEKRAFRVSTARKMRVLTAPTEMPRVSAISAYGIPW